MRLASSNRLKFPVQHPFTYYPNTTCPQMNYQAQPRPPGGIDPAALVVASVALLGTTMLGSGSFTVLSSILGLTIMVVVYGYDENPKRTFPQQAAFAMVIGFAATVVLGAPAEWAKILPPPHECFKRTAYCADIADAVSKRINAILFGIWVTSTLFVLACESERGRHGPRTVV